MRRLRGLVLVGLLVPTLSLASRHIEAMANETVAIETKTGLGAGVLLSNEGRILTASHLFHKGMEAGSVTVTLRSGEKYTAQLVIIDWKNDLALVQIDQKVDDLPYARLANHSPALGDELWIVGHPFGLNWSVTRGVVSGLNRLGTGKIQSDAVANPGNSGGPMFNSAGEVVGILTNGLVLPFYIGQVFGVPLEVCRFFLHRSVLDL